MRYAEECVCAPESVDSRESGNELTCDTCRRSPIHVLRCNKLLPSAVGKPITRRDRVVTLLHRVEG